MSKPDQDDTHSSQAAAEGPEDQACTASQAATTADASGEDAEAPVEQSVDQQLEAARRESAENYERFLRAKADIENILKRQQRELADRARYDGESLAREVLQSIDDLERALAHAGEEESAVRGGIDLVLKGLLAALKRHGVEKIEAEAKAFDPAEHEAVAMVESAEVAPGTVLAVFRPGYKMRDRLLRAAMVSVARAVEANPEE